MLKCFFCFFLLFVFSFHSSDAGAAEEGEYNIIRHPSRPLSEKVKRVQRVKLYDMVSKAERDILAFRLDYWESKLEAVYAYPEYIDDELQLYVSHVREIALDIERRVKSLKKGKRTDPIIVHPELPVREWFVNEETLLAYLDEVSLGIREKTLPEWRQVAENIYLFPEHLTEAVKWKMAHVEAEGKKWDAERRRLKKEKTEKKKRSKR